MIKCACGLNFHTLEEWLEHFGVDRPNQEYLLSMGYDPEDVRKVLEIYEEQHWPQLDKP